MSFLKLLTDGQLDALVDDIRNEQCRRLIEKFPTPNDKEIHGPVREAVESYKDRTGASTGETSKILWVFRKNAIAQLSPDVVETLPPPDERRTEQRRDSAERRDETRRVQAKVPDEHKRSPEIRRTKVRRYHSRRDEDK